MNNFKEFHQKEIVPLIKKLNKERIKGRTKVWIIRISILIIAGIIIYFNSIYNFMPRIGGWFTFVIVLIVLFVVVSKIPSKLKKDKIRFTILPKIIAFIPDIEFHDVRYGRKLQDRIELMKQFLFHHYYTSCSEEIKIFGNKPKPFTIDLMTLIIGLSSHQESRRKHKSLHIYTETDMNLGNRVLLIPANMEIKDHKEWQENNLQKFEATKNYSIIAENKKDAHKCFTEPLMTAIDELLLKIQKSIIRSREILCGFYKNQFLMIVTLADININTVFDLKYHKKGFLSSENLIHIIEHINLIKNLVETTQINRIDTSTKQKIIR